MTARGTSAGRARLAAGVAAAALLAGTGAWAQAPACTRGDFETVVEEAAESLRTLNARNKPAFQNQLRLLKEKRGWSHDDFLTEAAPLVQDETILAYDQKAGALLAMISSMGQEGSAAKTPDCALLADLKGHMRALVEVQEAKWGYMFGKLGTEMAR